MIVSIDDIIAATAKVTGVTPEEVSGHYSTVKIMKARRHVGYIATRMEMSGSVLARAFNRDPASISRMLRNSDFSNKGFRETSKRILRELYRSKLLQLSMVDTSWEPRKNVSAMGQAHAGK